MLACRLVIYGSAIAATSAAATLVARSRDLAWLAGGLIFALSIPPHLYPGTVWDDYPVWYHVYYLVSIIPTAWLAGFAIEKSPLSRMSKSQPTQSTDQE